MRVTSNTFPDNLVQHLQRLTDRMNTLQNQTATGQRVRDPSDDPTAAVRVLNYQGERSRIAQYHRNALRADDIITASIAEIRNLSRASERANEIIALTSDLSDASAIQTYGIEINQLLEQALVNANANFNQEPLFGGTGADTTPYNVVRDASGNITSVTFGGTAATAEFQISDGARLSPYPSSQVSGEVLDFLNNLVSLRDAFTAGSAPGVKAQAATMQTSEDALINAMSGMGAMQSRIELETAQNRTRYSSLAEQISREADADLAQTVVELTQNQRAYEAALMSAGRVLDRSLLDYI